MSLVIGNLAQLPLPSFYDPKNALDWDYRPDIKAIRAEAARWRKLYSITRADEDPEQGILVLIDMQKDFMHKNGALYVAGRSGSGSPDDACRLVELAYRHIYAIPRLFATMDTHMKDDPAAPKKTRSQIFHPSFVVRRDGSPVAPFTVVHERDWISGEIKPSQAAVESVGKDLAWLVQQGAHYSRELARLGKPPLTIWPEHCIDGTEGHELLGVVDELLLFHSILRDTSPVIVRKGVERLFESYSVYGAEVHTTWDGNVVASARKDERLLKYVASSGFDIEAGEAGSHCVAASVRDYKNHLAVTEPARLRRSYILEDCMSPVTVPDGKGGFAVDCTSMQDAALAEFRTAGMNVVKSTEAHAWPIN